MTRFEIPPGSRLRRLAGCLLLVLIASVAQGAALVLRGVVRDSSQNILPGVKVVVRGSTVRTVTDENGEFTLSLRERTSGTLEFEKPGYAQHQLVIPSHPTPIEVRLAPNQNNAGLVRQVAKVSLSHSLTTVQQREPALLQRPLTAEVYRTFVARHGEAPAEEVLLRAYFPPGAARITAVFLISEHGIGGAMMEHPRFRDFADRHQLALVGVLGDPVQRGIYPAEMLESLLTDLGTPAGHPELARVPALTFGHSNGTGFSVLYAALRPERVLGWISFHSGGSWHLLFPGVENSPGLVVHGEKDPYFVNGQYEAVRRLRRERDAPVSLLVVGGAGHWPADREQMYALVIAYLEACIRLRAPQGLDGVTRLAAVPMSRGWMADCYDLARGGFQLPAIAPYTHYAGDRATANWLPDEAFARAWQRFSASGSITDGGSSAAP